MNRRLQYSILTADLLWIATACGFTHWAQKGSGTSPGLFQWANVLAALLIWSLLYVGKKLEGFRGGWHFPRVCAQVTVAVAYLIGSLLMLTFTFGRPYELRELFALGSLVPIGLIGIRCLVRWFVNSRANARTKRRVIILGR